MENCQTITCQTGGGLLLTSRLRFDPITRYSGTETGMGYKQIETNAAGKRKRQEKSAHPSKGEIQKITSSSSIRQMDPTDISASSIVSQVIFHGLL